MSEPTEKCPNCGAEFKVSKFCDLEDCVGGGIFDVTVTSCVKCEYINDCVAE